VLPATAAAELQTLLDANGGLLKPTDVIEWAAANADSALYGLFEWKDDIAAQRFRLVQARQLIRIWKFRPNPLSTETRRITASLPSDRTRGGGYRSANQIETTSALRMERLLLALSSVESAARSHLFLQELAPSLTTIIQLLESQRSKLLAEGTMLDQKQIVG
jgi:hypothetical protein